MIVLDKFWCFLFLLVGGVVLFVAVCFAVYDYDLSVANPLSTYDILLPGTMTAAIVMMSAASVQKKMHCHHDLPLEK